MTLTSDNVKSFNGQIPGQNDPPGGQPMGSFERADVGNEVQAMSFTRQTTASSASEDTQSMEVDEDKPQINEAHWHVQEAYEDDDNYDDYNDDIYEDEGEDDMDDDDYGENDFSIMGDLELSFFLDCK